jgi:phytoene dehydrogenase-like protein
MSKIIVVGAGIGGLAAGCYARLNDFQATIFESGERAGGLCTSWNRGGFTFDGCIRHFAGLKPETALYKMWNDLGAVPAEAFFPEELVKVVDESGREFTVYYDTNRLEEEMKRLAPEDSATIEEYIKAIKLLSRIELMEVGFWKFSDWLKNIPTLVKSGRYSRESMNKFAERFSSPVLRRFFPVIQYGWKNIPLTLHLAVMAGSGRKMYGRYAGGSYEFSRAIEKRFLSLGGELRYNTRIEKVLADNGAATGVQLESGEKVTADYVISDIYGYDTFMKLLDDRYLTDRLRSMYSWPIDRMMMAIHVSLGVGMDLSQMSNSIAFFPDRPLEIAGEKHEMLNILNYGYDSSMAPKGKTALKVMYDTSYSYWEGLYKDRQAYEDEKRKIAGKTIEILERIFPGLGDAVEVIDVATPMTTKRYTANGQGFGRKEDFRLKDTLRGFLSRPLTLERLKNFYVIGHSVGGTNLYGCAAMGRNTVKSLCKREKRRFIASVE